MPTEEYISSSRPQRKQNNGTNDGYFFHTNLLLIYFDDSKKYIKKQLLDRNKSTSIRKENMANITSKCLPGVSYRQ